MIKKTLLLLLVLFILSSPFTLASVGLGISPSRMEHRVEGGKTFETEYLVYNSGTIDIIARFNAEGDITPYVTFEEQDMSLLSEPEPHRFPPVYGKRFKVKYSPPPTSTAHQLTGYIVASGGPAQGSQLGGNVAVAMRMTLNVDKTKRFWNYITPVQWTIGGITAGILLLLFGAYTIARRKGIRLRVEVARRPRK